MSTDRVIHFEIHADDPAACARWYSEMFGWRATLAMPQMEYWTVATGEGPGIDGGILKRMGPNPAPGAPVSSFVCTINVTDLDMRMTKLLSNGAREALPKFAVPTVGWMAYFIDPFGNICGMHQTDAGAA